ncbi:GAF domain-containing protein [Pigmentiphaga sp.]|uniref:GAF domain-containing protein n=1 Tax=Pigmentiphaga sp. TaxID=1977564 RepID=UPI0025D1684C|nr:GAF domain-containing protein [Pigmentiphaga sp.]
MIRLDMLEDCFEGVIPSVIATTAIDGTPNISYLSHVVRVDERHVAISNQFFAKTTANIRANPRASLMLVSGRTGAQFQLALTWTASHDQGTLFDRMANELRASSAQVGMAGVMRLKAIDVFRVEAIVPVNAPRQMEADAAPPAPDLARVNLSMQAIALAQDAEGVLNATLDACIGFGAAQALVLLDEGDGTMLTTVASRGYETSGIGSETPVGEGLIGMAAASRLPLKVNDMSRVRRMGAAIEAIGTVDENRTRTIALPSAPQAMSQMAVPILVHATLRGVLFVESPVRLAFGKAQEKAIEIAASQSGLALALCETLAARSQPRPEARRAGQDGGRRVRIVHHEYDDSIFIDDAYVIKGVAGRLLVYMLERYLAEGRSEFTNREIRLATTLRLPELKDNLETRLLLLRRRLDERASPVRLVHSRRGCVRLEIDGQPTLAQSGPARGLPC